jgi:hypothetical protein
MFIDCDEFVVPISTKTIPEFLKDFEQFGGLELNWLNYGSSGEKTHKEGLVMERFKAHATLDAEGNKAVKTVANPRRTTFMDNHYAHYALNYFAVNTHKGESDQWLPGNHFSFSFIDKIRINHYSVKSHEEWLEKQAKGQATNPGFLPMSFFELRDTNDVQNDPIMDKYIPLVYENLQKRLSKS